MRWILAAACLGLTSICVSAQEAPQKKQPTPEEMQRIMESAMGPMVPLMAKMTDAMLEAMLQKSAEPQTASRIAQFKRNLYQALLKEGFTKDEALSIVLNTGLPTASPQSR